MVSRASSADREVRLDGGPETSCIEKAVGWRHVCVKMFKKTLGDLV